MLAAKSYVHTIGQQISGLFDESRLYSSQNTSIVGESQQIHGVESSVMTVAPSPHWVLCHANVEIGVTVLAQDWIYHGVAMLEQVFLRQLQVVVELLIYDAVRIRIIYVI